LAARSDLIVRGIVTEVVQKNDVTSYGTIRITDIIYGPAKLSDVQFCLRTGRAGNNVYAPGDRGVFFLITEQRDRADRALVFHPMTLEQVRESIFVADHPDTFWPEKQEFIGRNPGVEQIPDPERHAVRLSELYALVGDRVLADMQRLSLELVDACKRLEYLRSQSSSLRAPSTRRTP